jgi:hypothetical protein
LLVLLVLLLQQHRVPLLLLLLLHLMSPAPCWQQRLLRLLRHAL